MKICLSVFLVLLFWNSSVYAQNTDITTDKTEPEPRLLVLPFPFFNDTIGAGVGVAAISNGYIQRQMTAVAAALFSDNDSAYGFLLIRNFQIPWVERVFWEPQIFGGEFGTINVYLDGNSDFTDEDSGSNDSDEDNFVETEGTDFFFESKLKFLLPIGNGKDHIIPKYRFEDGVLLSGASGGEQYNPFKSGRTYFEVTPFFRKQDAEAEEDVVGDDEFLQKTAGIDLALAYDNTDFLANPSKGSYQEISFSRDWGALNSTSTWSVWKLDLQKYFSLGATKRAKQRVIALNFWTGDTPTWDSHGRDSAGDKEFHRPPTYKGANLGGLWRLRGYPATRFHDQSAIYYGAEYRYMLNWNPLRDITLGNRLDVTWLQLVAFAELGRVASAWNIETLHEDMKGSAGAGIRAMVNNIIVRIDYAVSEEEMIAQLFIGHPF